MLTLTSPFDTWMHGLPAGAKLLSLVVVTTLLFAWNTPVVCGMVAMAVLSLYLTIGIRFTKYGLRRLRPLWPFLLMLALWNGYRGSYAEGALIALRLVAVVGLANLVTMTTRLDDLITLVERILSPLQRFGLSPRITGLAIAMVLRFTPALMDKAAHLGESWKARRTGKPSWRIVLPLTLLALDDADHVAEALRARGGV